MIEEENTTVITYDDIRMLGEAARDAVIDLASELGVKVRCCSAMNNYVAVVAGSSPVTPEVVQALRDLELPEGPNQVLIGAGGSSLQVEDAMAVHAGAPSR